MKCMNVLPVAALAAVAVLCVPALVRASDEVKAAAVKTPALEEAAALLVAPAARRGFTLPTLYVTLGALQATDVYTTHVGLGRGALEANPMLKDSARNRTAMIVAKAATTVATVALSEKLWKTNRAAAIALMVGVNGTMAAVAARNVQVIRGLK